MMREKIGRWIIKNPGWRLLSLVLAVIIWMNVATEREMSNVQSVRLQPETQEIVGPEASVRAVQEAVSDPVNLAAVNLTKPVVTAELYLSDAQVRFVSQPRVTVTMVLK